MKIGIRLKFTLFLAVLLILSVGLLSWLVLRGIQDNQTAQIEEVLARQTQLANLRLKQEYYTETPQIEASSFYNREGVRLASELADLTGMPVTLYAKDRSVLGSSVRAARGQTGQLQGADLESLDYALAGQIAYFKQAEDPDTLLYFAPVEGPEGQIGAIRFDYPVGSYGTFYDAIRRLFLVVGVSVVLAAFLLGYAYYSRFASAILKLKASADQIRQGRFLAAEPLRRSDELGELGRGITYMSGEIERSIAGLEDERAKLAQAVERLQALEHRQKQYIGNISHEFKTPLTTIKAYTELLEMYGDDPQLLGEARGSIGKEAQRLYEMVEKVLRLSALERYDFELEASEVDVPAALTDVVSRMRGKAEQFGVTLELDASPAVIWCDAESFMHICTNLLDNAIKYNRPGGFARIESGLDADGKRARLVVSNTGLSIPDEARGKIFEPFYTVNKDRARLSGGSGLGLSLVKRLVETQGGRIALLQTEGEGTSFELSFPAAESGKSAE
ncbi:HAMP domain-containing sensor histidine kinase [Saccharibacillus sp. CPCC 101409]|uniref:sensor histidine kinase n=1 Tax=Saccharibacillus sp. CPCC 101409 TaxID=3058041 RepID=UPI0026735116|nr:HAMP domain-containing sensor histidine kinase [Saccharibacillus sp. CPCC 101409]MDO3411834.1 HAMP domain-containing sensor histidine kinase [Saccharibacillus sp. CPCC 101409]